jgi:hypothetical protein
VASTTISAYNSLMGGCDLGDQKASYYLRHFKSRRPYMVMFFWLFHTSVINASILHRLVTAPGKPVAIKLKTFTEQLALAVMAKGKQLIADAPLDGEADEDIDLEENTESEGEAKVVIEKRHHANPNAPVRLSDTHHPCMGLIAERGSCAVCRGSRKGLFKDGVRLDKNLTKTGKQNFNIKRMVDLTRNKCAKCPGKAVHGQSMGRNKTKQACADCHVFLHFRTGPNGPSCWDTWHEEDDMKALRI